MLLAPGRDLETTAFRTVLDTIRKGGQDFEGGGSQWGESLGAALGYSLPPLLAPSARIHTWPHVLFFSSCSRTSDVLSTRTGRGCNRGRRRALGGWL